jgi:cytoskeletal protein RodZ
VPATLVAREVTERGGGGVSIGDDLAAARRQVGLTVTQVSQRTCIRETIIQGIEHDDYSGCGGAFYARGHIRSIARAIGTDPDPFVRDYDAAQGPPPAVTAADIFQPSTPIGFKEKRRPNWTVAMALALALIVGLVAYHLIGQSRASTTAGRAATVHAQTRAAARQEQSQARQRAAQASRAPAHRVVIQLRAMQDCWVQLTTAAGRTIFTGFVYAGTARSWTVRQAVKLRMGNPGGVTLTVNGKSQSSGPPGQPVTLSFGPGQKKPG